MNYPKPGDSRESGGFRASAIKEACARHDRQKMKKSTMNQLKYHDSMQEALNKEI